MDEHWPFTGDAVEVTGLSVMLDEDETLPYLELGLRHAGNNFRAVVLVAEEEWAVSVRDESGRQLFPEPELYSTQAGAIVAAMLAVVHGTPPIGGIPSES